MKLISKAAFCRSTKKTKEFINDFYNDNNDKNDFEYSGGNHFPF